MNKQSLNHMIFNTYVLGNKDHNVSWVLNLC